MYTSSGPSWSWLYGSWIYNYLCNQCLSPLLLWVRTLLRRSVLGTILCDKVCQGLATDRWFSPDTPVSSTNKTDSHDITEILWKVALYTITSNPKIYRVLVREQAYTCHNWNCLLLPFIKLCKERQFITIVGQKQNIKDCNVCYCWQAVRFSTFGRPGPVYIDIAGNMVNQTVPEKDIRYLVFILKSC
jgi:hypothetical protein